MPHIRGVVLRAHRVRGELHIQRNATGEVATKVMNLMSQIDHKSTLVNLFIF